MLDAAKKLAAAGAAETAADADAVKGATERVDTGAVSRSAAAPPKAAAGAADTAADAGGADVSAEVAPSLRSGGAENGRSALPVNGAGAKGAGATGFGWKGAGGARWARGAAVDGAEPEGPAPALAVDAPGKGMNGAGATRPAGRGGWRSIRGR